MKYWTRIGEVERGWQFSRTGERLMAQRDDGAHFEVDLSAVGDGGAFSLIVDGKSYDCLLEAEQGRTVVQVIGERVVVEVQDDRERAAQRVIGHKGAGRRAIEAAMPGVVVEVRATVGEIVEDGATLVVLEAMKMQNPIPAEGRGKVVRVAVKKGDVVAAGSVLVELDDPAAAV
ncbi:MAG: biotin/lipoyl-containing protein [Planctomycetota bacterium]